MTTVAFRFAIARREEARWSVCFAVAPLAHAAVVLAMLRKLEVQSLGMDAQVVTLELPESFLVVATPPTDLAPGPKQEESQATLPPNEDAKPPEAEAEVAIPQPPKPEPPQEQKQATAPPAAAPVPAAVVHRWETQLLAHIERFKRYPLEARAHGDQGVVRVAFTIDRDGWVRQSRLVKSSGSPDLDQEALAMLSRSQPVPRPPERVPASELSFIVPVQFQIR
jgi:periplasmic protein TonB